MRKEIFPIIGMHCASCKMLIEKMVSKVEGVSSVNVNYATEKMTVSFDSAQDDNLLIENIAKAVAKAGSYKLIQDTDGQTVLADPTKARKMMHESHSNMNHGGSNSGGSAHDHAAMLKKEDYIKLVRKVKIVGILSIPFVFVMIYMLLMSFGVVEKMHDPLGMIMFSKGGYEINLFFFLQFLLATPVLFWGGNQFYSSTWSALKARAANMDTLIALGTTTAWVFSTVVTFAPGIFDQLKADVFYEAAVFIVFFILLGKVLEARAKGQANDAISKLLELQAKDATVIRDGMEIKVPVTEVQKEDIILVRPGEKVPVDGVIIEGASTIDESMVTGESIPVTKTQEDKVIGSTINKTSTFKFRATKVGSETMLAQIIQMVEEAQGTTAPIQKLADKISGVFVPIVIVIAILAFLFWAFIASALGLTNETENLLQLAIYVATTVLIIACPCALGLATPTAVMVGTGKAAGRGILVKDARALELAHKIDTIVFDKTGTLTKGQPEVTDFEFDGIDEKEILEIAYAVENLSEHPLSDAIAKFAEENKVSKAFKVDRFKNIEGKGVEGFYEGKKVVLGNSRLMNEESINISGELKKRADKFISEGKTTIYMSIDSKNVGVFAIADMVKEESKIAVERLHNLGIKVVMLTGDNQKTAEAIASTLGIDDIFAEVLPSDKQDVIKAIQNGDSSTQVVAMVGDGINDAPALAQADIGIAMGTGTDVAIEAGDIVLVKGTLDKVIETIELSKSTLSVIKQNLFWAFGYNVIAIPVAAGILYPPFGILLSPIIASAAMAFSSISVVLNSLRLKRK